MNRLARPFRRPRRQLAGERRQGVQFFVVGTGRCGTTLLRDILNLHPELFVPAAESHWIVHQYQAHGAGPRPTRSYADVLDRVSFLGGELTVDVMASGVGWSKAQLYDAADLGAECTLAAFNDRLFGALARAAGRNVVGDKTPCHCLAMPLLSRLWPQAKFVHVVRDGRDVALSMADHPGFERMVECASDSWSDLALDRRCETARRACSPVLEDYMRLWALRATRAVSDAKDLPPGAYLEIRYEQLLRRPRRESSRLAAFLGVPPTPGWLGGVEATIVRKRRRPPLDRRSWQGLTRVGAAALSQLGYPT